MMQAFEGIRVLDLTIWQLTSPVDTRPAQAHNLGAASNGIKGRSCLVWSELMSTE